MEAFIEDNSRITKLKEKECINGVIIENTMENGSKIKWKVMVNFSGLMEESIKEIILMIRKKALVYSLGLIRRFIEDSGRKESSMDMELFNLVMDKREMDNGNKVNIVEQKFSLLKKQNNNKLSINR